MQLTALCHCQQQDQDGQTQHGLHHYHTQKFSSQTGSAAEVSSVI